MCKQTLESWNFKIDGNKKILEIQSKTEQDNAKKHIKIIDTTGGHYGIVLETKKKPSPKLFFVEEDSGILFVQDDKGDLCSFKSLRKVHEVNQHKGKDQLIAAYRNARWMIPGLANIIERV